MSPTRRAGAGSLDVCALRTAKLPLCRFVRRLSGNWKPPPSSEPPQTVALIARATRGLRRTPQQGTLCRGSPSRPPTVSRGWLRSLVIHSPCSALTDSAHGRSFRMLAAAPPACRQGVTPLAAGAARGVKPAARVGAGRREGALAASRNLSSLHAPLAGTALQGERQDAAERRRSGTGGGRRAFLCRAAQAGGRPAFNKGPLKLPSYFGLNPQYKEDWRVALPADIVAGA